VETCEKCLQIANELKGYLSEAKSLLDRGQDERLRVVEAMRGGEADAHTVEDFFAAAPRLRPGAYPGMAQAMARKFEHERRTGHRVLDLPSWPF
jgi:hypothetical protein